MNSVNSHPLYMQVIESSVPIRLRRTTLQVGERKRSNTGTKGQTYVAWMHHVSVHRYAFHVSLECLNGSSHGRSWSSGQFNLDGNQPCGSLDHKVHFRSSQGSPKIDLRINPSMRQRLKISERTAVSMIAPPMGPAAAWAGSLRPAR